MKKDIKGLLLAAIVSAAGSAQADAWPRLSPHSTATECRQALQIAEATFHSDEPALYAPPVVPEGLPSRLVLGPAALDLSGGDALVADPAVFDKRPGQEHAFKSVFWQKTARAGHRLVVRETPRGWRGDTYTLLSIPEQMTPEELTVRIGPVEPGDQIAQPLFTENRRPPLVFWNEASSSAWVIRVGEPGEVLTPWLVYEQTTGGLELQCTVRFSPLAQAADATRLLPLPVATLVRQLDAILGWGKDEGTLQPTAGLRQAAGQTWGNVAQRPWALGSPYNTRAEVDAGLSAWAGRSAWNRAWLLAINRQYPRAEQALAAHYERHFMRPAGAARAAARYALDIAYRKNFVFPREGFAPDAKNAPNPWRAGGASAPER